MKTFKNLELIEITPGWYCIRKTTKTLFGKEKITFIVMNRLGLGFEDDQLGDGITIAQKERAVYVFNALVIQLGGNMGDYA